jgi:putative ABC transport system permease protein
VETSSAIPIAVYRPDGLDIVRTYPDGGHGSLTLRSTPPESRMLELPILVGRWLQAGDTDGIVLNQLAAAFFPAAKPGDAIRAMVNGRTAAFHVVGLVRQVMTPATAYVTPGGFADATGLPAQAANSVRIVTKEHDAASIASVTGEIGRALEGKDMGVKAFIPKAMVMAAVGALGLMSSMGTAVTERTREFGVMRAIGARQRIILRNVIGEGVIVAAARGTDHPFFGTTAIIG